MKKNNFDNTVHAYILVYNEQDFLPFTLDHYAQFCEKIFILDNESTDKSIEIALQYPQVEIITWHSSGQTNDLMMAEIKSEAYRASKGKADWVIVCDCDEILYHYQELPKLKKQGVMVPGITGYDMVSEIFPIYDEKNICEKICHGVENPKFNKQIVFNPQVNITFSPGAHSCHYSSHYKSAPSNLILLHYKWLSLQNVLDRNITIRKRLSKVNLEFSWGSHYLASEVGVEEEFKKIKQTSRRII